MFTRGIVPLSGQTGDRSRAESPAFRMRSSPPDPLDRINSVCLTKRACPFLPCGCPLSRADSFDACLATVPPFILEPYVLKQGYIFKNYVLSLNLPMFAQGPSVKRDTWENALCACLKSGTFIDVSCARDNKSRSFGHPNME
jgi:hypothetical protein